MGYWKSNAWSAQFVAKSWVSSVSFPGVSRIGESTKSAMAVQAIGRLIWIKIAAKREQLDRWEHVRSEGAALKTLRQLLSAEDVIQLVIRLGLLALLIIWTFVIIRPFVPILAWSAVLAVAFYPVFSWLARILGGRPKLAAVILTLFTLGVVIGPATWLGVSAVQGGKRLAGQVAPR